MKKIVVKNIKTFHLRALAQLLEVPFHLLKNLNQLNISPTPTQSSYDAFKHDLLKWIRHAPCLQEESRFVRAIETILQQRYIHLKPELVKSLVLQWLKADLDNAVMVSLSTDCALPSEDWDAIFLQAIKIFDPSGATKHLEQTAQHYSPAVVQFGTNLLNLALFRSRQVKLLDSVCPEVKLVARRDKIALLCTYRGPLGVVKMDKDTSSAFELIPLELPIQYEMQWLPTKGWVCSVPDSREYCAMYEKLGLDKVINLFNSYHKELFAVMLGSTAGSAGLVLPQLIEQIGTSGGELLLLLGSVTVLISGVASYFKGRNVPLD